MNSKRRLYHSPPHLSGREEKYLQEALADNWIAPVGPQLDRFEQLFAERIGVEHAVAVTSGTAALHLILRYLQIEPGREVVCSTFTFCASANPIVYEGARPLFIDSDWRSWNLDPNLLRDELQACAGRGQLPQAIVVVDILGQSADMDAIGQIAAEFNIALIEDAAEALGATYKKRSVGSSSWASFFSFNGNKIITTSGGGMICTNDGKLAESARFLATQARDPAPFYLHTQIGFNYRLSNLLAAVGLGQLEVLDERVAARRRIRQHYRDHLGKLAGVALMPEADYGQSNCWLTTVLIDPNEFGSTCEDVRMALESENIEARRVWKPLHTQPVFAGCRVRGGDVAQQIFQQGLCLPSGSGMSEEDLERVVGAVERVARR